MADAPRDGIASRQTRHGSCRRVRTGGLSAWDAPRIRCRDPPGRPPDHAAAEMDGSRAAEHDHDLCDGVRAGRTRNGQEILECLSAIVKQELGRRSVRILERRAIRQT